MSPWLVWLVLYTLVYQKLVSSKHSHLWACLRPADFRYKQYVLNAVISSDVDFTSAVSGEDKGC